ncbi:hypothetical protein BDF22DRAFT_668331 [Syncephalis plumigaleata]|nr:hypothetical protein BDF22DRAFT_668331 [Syncephalis plumigaleata]
MEEQSKPVVRGQKVEWTVLAGIVVCHQEEPNSNTTTTTTTRSMKCVALGTGLKCLPQSQLTNDGSVVFDEHAEVMARRFFIRYLLAEIKKADQQLPSLFRRRVTTSDDAPSFVLADPQHTSFHMYISQAPCGDASMEALAAEQSEASLQAFTMVEQTDASSPLPSSIVRGRVGYKRLACRVDAEPTLCMSCRCVWMACL